MKNWKNIIRVIFLLTYGFTFGQDNTKSEIIISEDNLISLIQNIKRHRDQLSKDIYNNKSNKEIKEITNQNNYHFFSEVNTNDNDFLKEMRSKIINLELQIKNLEKKIIDSDRKVIINEKTIINNQKRISEIKNESKSSVKKDSVVKLKTAEPFKFKRHIYFDNNSIEINPKAVLTLEEIAKELSSNENQILVLKGFSSAKGNKRYNKELSFYRTESTKNCLISLGVHPDKILTKSYEIDQTSKSEENARRVEISFIKIQKQ